MNRLSLNIVSVVMVIFSLIFFAGCSKPPTEEMTKAEKAIEEARQKEAPTYVPDLFEKADASLKKAKDFITNKKYKEAKQIAIETETLARQAIAGIEAAKTKVKAEAEQEAQAVQKGIDDLKALVAGAEKKKALKAVREEIQGVITQWETDFAAIKEKLQGQKIKEAGDELKAMKEQVVKKLEEATAQLTAPAAPAAAPAKKK